MSTLSRAGTLRGATSEDLLQHSLTSLDDSAPGNQKIFISKKTSL